MPNPFYVKPAGENIGGQLVGLGQVIAQTREKQEEKRKEDAKKLELVNGQRELQAAYESDDPDKVAKVIVKNPLIAQQAKEALGIMNSRHEKDFAATAMSILSDPDNAVSTITTHAQDLIKKGQDPKIYADLAQEFAQAEGNPAARQKALRKVEIGLAMGSKSGYDAWKEQNEPKITSIDPTHDVYVNGKLETKGVPKADSMGENPSFVKEMLYKQHLEGKLAALPAGSSEAAAVKQQLSDITAHIATLANPEGGTTDKAPSGYRKTADGNLEPIPGGPADPAKQGQLGSREQVFLQRVMTSANEAAKDLENVVKLPLTASTGTFGGRQQSPSLLGATKEVLANKMTGQEAQSYNVLSSGFQRSLASIEAAGLAPSGTLSHQMDAVLFKEGDTNITKLQKLAQTRQIVEAGLETADSNPRIPDSQRAHIKKVVEAIRKAVPFTHSDIFALQQAQEKNPKATLKSVMDEMKQADSEAEQWAKANPDDPRSAKILGSLNGL